MAQSILIVVAHPDDEVLGCGGVAARFASVGHAVRTCILSGAAEVRQARPETNELLADTIQAQNVMGAGMPIIGDFPNIQFNTVEHLRVVQFIEEAIRQTRCQWVFTHHPWDVNDDHRHTSHACQAAVRLFQRQPDTPSLKGLYFMEVQSSTDWSMPGSGAPFHPNAFFEIGEAGLQLKLEALRAYRGVMRPYPHPRSEEAIRGLAAYRGAQAGMRYAEAFQVAFCDLNVAFGGL